MTPTTVRRNAADADGAADDSRVGVESFAP